MEPYQPLYGLTGIVEEPARESLDRARTIAAALEPVRGQRILDIGSSLGYMSFYLGDRGALTTGWEYNADNVEVARQVGAITGVPATFVVKELTVESVATIEPGLYDTALVLAVFHHVVHFQGLDAAQMIVRELLDRIPVLVLELAVRGEDPGLFWDAAQPEDPLELLALVKDDVDVELLGTFGTHLSSRERPLYRVARRRTVRVGPHTYPFDRQSWEAYQDSPAVGGPWRRRYYHGADHVVKEYVFTHDAPDNWQQILNELVVHTTVGSGSPVHHAMRLRDCELTSERALLVLDRVHGDLLGDLGAVSAATLRPVVRDVVTTLRDLRARGIHHNDVRSWNIMVADDGGWLLDYGRAAHAPVEDDVIALAWAVAAAARGVRESPQEGKSELPDLAPLAATGLAAFADALRDGERDLDALLHTL